MASTRWLDAETSTMEQALAWSLEHDHTSAARLAAALGPWWILRGRVADTDRNLRAATVLADPGSDLWCRLQLLVGENIEHISLENALVHYSAACDDAADGGPSPILADALGRQAHALVNLSRRDGAAEKARASLAMSRELGYLAGVAYSLATLGEAAFHAGRGDEALHWYQQAYQVDATEIPGTLSRMR